MMLARSTAEAALGKAVRRWKKKSPPDTGVNEYTILDVQKGSTLQKKLSEAAQQGSDRLE